MGGIFGRRWRRAAARGLSGILGAALVAADVGGALAVECRDVQDAEAAHLRWLQTQMMVAALSCQGAELYNDFVARNRSDLDWSVARLNGMFERDHGKNGGAQYNQFLTRLANEAAADRGADARGFCPNAQAMFDEAQIRTPGQIRGYSTQRTVRAGVLPATCAREAALAQKR